MTLLTRKEKGIVPKTILLTFDVELFFGRSGSLKKCILSPVEKLVHLFDLHNIKGTFFIDVLYYMRICESKTLADEGFKMRELMHSLVSRGHRIELHLHPHWLDAILKGSEWHFPTYRYYRLQSLPKEKITDLFVTGSQILNELANAVKTGYKVSAFRAGGYCALPFSNMVEGFQKTGIKIDSSIAKGFLLNSETHNVDYTNAPSIEHYRFRDDPLIIEDQGEFLEIPITTFQKGFFDKAFLKAERWISSDLFKMVGDGKGMAFENVQIKNKAIRKISTAWEMFSLDSSSRRLFLNKVSMDRRHLINVISHPKMLMPESFEIITELVKKQFAFETVYSYAEKNLHLSKEVI